MQNQKVQSKTPFMYKRKEGEPVLLQDMSLVELHEELAFTRKRKQNLEFVEGKLEKEIFNRLKKEPAPTRIIVTTNKAIG